jgi:hypothetical protein
MVAFHEGISLVEVGMRVATNNGTLAINPMQTMRIADAVERLRGVFLEVPGTRLSVSDASRLSGLERTTCGAVLSALEDAHFLMRTRNGLFTRRTNDSPLAD